MNIIKKLLFISHANPQDNDAALWLASKLSLAGYEVWSDLTRLFGGEYFWEDIEDAIRNQVAKFVVLVSKNSQNASGLLDELNLAVMLERKQNLTRFVIPIRLDDLPFDEFKVNIARKNSIDFSKNWADGVAQLIECLETDKIIKNEIKTPHNIVSWYHSQYLKSNNIIQKPQVLNSNWISIFDLPSDISFSRIPVSPSRANEIINNFDYPAFIYNEFVGSFASHIDLQPKMPVSLFLTHGHKIKVADFIEGETAIFPALKWQEGQNLISSLLSKAWDKEMHNKGLLSFRMSDHSNCWFLNDAFVPNNKVKFVDADGKNKSIKLVGKSERYNVNWHFGVSIHPSFARLKHFSLKSHVIFSLDGKTPLGSKEQMHTLRRSFCRNWWNEKWRRLLLAYLTYLSDMPNNIRVNVAPNLYFSLNSEPLKFNSPVSLEETVVQNSEESENTLDESFEDNILLDDFEDSVFDDSKIDNGSGDEEGDETE
jgi:hypothetical protein